MQPPTSQRFIFLGVAILFHGVAFVVLCRFLVFPPSSSQEDSESFAQITLPSKTIPPLLPSSVTPLPSFSPAPSMAVSGSSAPTLIVRTMSSLPVPKIDLPSLPAISAHPSTSHLDDGLGDEAAGNGIKSTGSYGDMDAFLRGDKREGEIVGFFIPDNHPFKDAAPMDEVRQRTLTIIGWYIAAEYSHGHPGIKHGADVPILSQFPERFANQSSSIADTICATLLVNGALKDTKVKTFVLVSNFRDSELPSLADAFRHDATATQERASFNGILDKLINALSTRGIRLCIISFENPPYPGLLDYVKTSGGICLYPNGVPADKIALQLKQAGQK